MASKHWLAAVLARADQHVEGLHLSPDLEPEAAWRDACYAVPGLTARQLTSIVASHFRLDVADLDSADPKAQRLIPRNVQREHLVYPLREDYRRLVVATSDPTDGGAEQAIAFASGRRTVFEIAAPEDIKGRVAQSEGDDWVFGNLLRSLDDEVVSSVHLVGDSGPERVGEMEVESGPVVQITDKILGGAIARKASDIHIGPGPNGGAVRLRIDGVLRTMMRLPISVMNRIISRIKVLSDLDIADRVRPQDGRARVRAGGKTYDLRVSTVPTRGSEKAVVRILDPSAAFRLADLELPDDAAASIGRLLTNREGVVVVTGPTGSGKTTTLYACLREKSDGAVNVMTAEDPVEYDLPTATQIEINEKQGVTFPSALRAMLRQDPDVILVGEVRDHETGEMALRASMTGHLVLTTLHANDAPGVVDRLTDLGLNPAIVASTLRGAVAQRLVRRVCERCATPVGGDSTQEEERLTQVFGVRPRVRAVGCPACADTGFHGRIPVLEVMVVTPKLEHMIGKGASHTEVRAAAIEAGMTPLLARAQELVTEGRTTLQELSRVLGEDVDGEEAEEAVERPSILLVDDDSVTRSVARVVLEADGFTVDEVGDGVAALERLDQRTAGYAAVILDLDMPRMGGEETLERIRTSPRSAALPVVVLTGSDGGGAEARVMEGGADDYIRKPVDPASFTDRVSAVLRRSGLDLPEKTV